MCFNVTVLKRSITAGAGPGLCRASCKSWILGSSSVINNMIVSRGSLR